MSKLIYFKQAKSLDDVEKTYEGLCKVLGLKAYPKDHYLRMAVDEEYNSAKQAFRVKEKPILIVDFDYTMDEILAKIKGWNCEAELCGSWLWIFGRNIFSRKNDLKELGFRYAKNKKAWYWRPVSAKSSNEEPMPMEFIREKYGSERIELAS